MQSSAKTWRAGGAWAVLVGVGALGCTATVVSDGLHATEGSDTQGMSTMSDGPPTTTRADEGTGSVDAGSDETTGDEAGSTSDGSTFDGSTSDASTTDGSTSDASTETGDTEDVCAAEPAPCDSMSNDPWNALGLNCPGGPQVQGTIATANPAQVFVHQGNVGTHVDPITGPAFPPQEGEKLVILSSGNAAQFLSAHTGNAPSTAYNSFAVDLPPPIQMGAVSMVADCFDDPSLVGTGDCSNTIEQQYMQGGGARDYAELRMVAEVPESMQSVAFDFAFFSVEYPTYYSSQYNDMFIVWLESETWTGNVSFDDQGNPISLNAAFLDYKDGPNPYDCPAPCEAPELAGMGAQGHAGTRWLTTNAPVTPGETVEVIFAIFDLSDANLDSAVLLDNVRWSCEGGQLGTDPVPT